jgi:diguanylate cyclase (GGDEF)-like protein
VARYGGEEFAVLLPGAVLAQAHEVAERLRSATRAARILHLDGSPLPGVTISAGAAQLPASGSADAFLELADRALYRAKQAGRDRVA